MDVIPFLMENDRHSNSVCRQPDQSRKEMNCGLDVEPEIAFREGQYKKNMRKLQISIFAISLAAAMSASATLLVDRGLPIGNLNDTVPNYTAGSSRANVAWAFTQYTPSDYYVVGDTFVNTSSQTWSINTIRLWTVGSTTTAALWGGIDGSTIGVVSSTYSMQDAHYASPKPNDLY